MNLISRIQFPRTPETSSLYLICNEGAFLNLSKEQTEVSFNNNGSLSLNTYFNSFYESYYVKYTELKSLYYLLNLEGDFQISLYREHYAKESKELIFTSSFEKCLLSEPIKVFLPETWRSENAGRAYLEISCLSNQGLFTRGCIATEQPKIQEVSLGIITCTFKKEVYVKNTVNTILKDDFLQNKNFKVFIVDNGKTLKQNEFNNQKIQLIPNRNVGGSGGFTRGLLQALEENNYTHFLFMDDDIELDSEAIYRLFSLYEYAKQDFAVAGSMLDFYKKHVLYEAGALYNKSFDHKGNIHYHPFQVAPLKRNLDLRNTATLNFVLVENNIDYGGFWFFAFPKKIVENIGLPLPFFIKIDDMEFGLRIKKYFENSIVAFPSIAVWHEPFYAKKPIWDIYYATRNNLITSSIHDLINYFSAIKNVTISIFYYLLLYDYNSAHMQIKGFEDYLKGEDLIIHNEPEEMHSRIYEDSKTYKTQFLTTTDNLYSKEYKTTKISKFKKIISFLTLNGSLLPQFLISNDSAFILEGSQERDSICKGFGKRRIVFVMENNQQSYQNEMDSKAAINILFAWFQTVISSSFIWSSVKAKWKKSAKELSSVQFWHEYLKLQNLDQ